MLRAAFLRGINVGRVRVPMAELRDLFGSLGLQGAATILNTGNVVFDSALAEADLRAMLEPALSTRFDYDARVFVLELAEVESAARLYPFESLDGFQRYALICDEARSADDLLAAADEPRGEERVTASGRFVFWRVERGRTTDAPFSKLIASKRFGPHVTNRNLNTLERIAASRRTS